MGILKNLKSLFGKRSGLSGFRPFNTNFNQVSNEKWNPYLIPPVAETRDTYERLVARCRDIAQNDSYGQGIVTTFQENVVTDRGIQIQNISEVPGLSALVDGVWREYCESQMSSLSETMNLIELQRQTMAAFLSDGEVFVKKHFTPDGFKFELVDSALVPYGLLTRANKGQRYLNGILVNSETKKVLGYRINDVGMDTYRLGASINQNVGEFVAADEILHVAIKKRIGQVRGEPLLKAVAGRIFKISQYENAVLDNATSAAKKYGFFAWDKDAESPPDIELKFSPSNSESGSFHELPQGINVETFSSQFPDDELGSFTRAILLATARAIGVSYPTLSGDLLSVNYASIRQAVLAERTVWNALQEFIYLKLMYPIYKDFFMDLLGRGQLMLGRRTLGLDSLPEILKVVTASVQFAEIDPRNENIVESSRIQNLVLAPSEVIRQRGGDPEQVWQQLSKDIQYMLDSGIPEAFVYSLFLRENTNSDVIVSLEEAGLLNSNSEVA